jgi:hypothetical protein
MCICGLFYKNDRWFIDLFIIFTYDFSRYGYIYSIKAQSKLLDKLKIFSYEVENQYDLNIKIVRSDHGGEYYGKHTLMDKFLDCLQGFYRKIT